MDTAAIREARTRPRTPIITDDDRARVDRYLLLNDFQPSSRALSAPCRSPRGDWHGTALGAEQAALAHEFTEVHGRGDDFYSIPVSNGTRAISLTLTALAVHADRLGLRRPRAGDNVIVPALTWPATATAALAVGFAPRLADVRAETLGIDPGSARGLVDDRTFAIIAVHLYHRLADIDELAAIAAEHGIALVEDCAHAHGASHRGRPAGSIGHAGTFSLQASKTLTSGEGGIVTTRHRLLAEQVASLANCGRPCGQALDIPSGNDRLPGLSAAFARAQLAEFGARQAARAELWAQLDKTAAGLPGVVPFPAQPWTISPTYKWAARYPLHQWGGLSLDEVAAALSGLLDVEISRVYAPLTGTSLYRPLNHPLAVSIHDRDELDPARYDGRHAVTASLSGHGEGKATPSCEGGMVVTSDPDVAALVRADTDCGNAPSRLDPIPYADFGPIPAGNQRMGEQPAALMLIQWLRAMHSRLQVRENRRLVTEFVRDSSLFPVPVLKVPPVDAEYPPFFCLHMECADALETELGLTPDDLRVALTAEGIWAEAGFVPTHLDPAWHDQIADVGFTYAGSKRVYGRAIFMHNKYLRDPDFPIWLAEILRRIRDHAGKLAGISESIPAGDRHRVTNPFVRKPHP